jgi:hypothetical protein
MWMAVILVTVPLRTVIPHTPMRARWRCERRHGAGPPAVGESRRRLLVLDAQLAERQRPATRVAADPQHGHARNLCQRCPPGNVRVRS